MTSQGVRIELEPRSVVGKKVKGLRRAGIIPVHLYGPGVASRALQCEEKTLLRALSAAGGENGGPLQVSVSGEAVQYAARAGEIQWHPRTGGILHLDLVTAAG